MACAVDRASSSTVPVMICASGSWNTVATSRLSAAIGVVAASWPQTVTDPCTEASSECGIRPLNAKARVDLPQSIVPA